ncbi:MAG TPA: tetratricopeptide repeat protein [Vicinamibacterales bacterium]|jgi:DNA-binding winged helix-turn-helix (wHTH) protein/tetratricopeptide (TPR) repeat protein
MQDVVVFGFGPFRLDPDTRQLSREGRPLRLTSRMFELLLFFVQNGGRPIRKDELMDAVWSDSPVEESNLPVTVSALRKVLGERRGQHQYLLTLPRYGYRFTPRVEWHRPAAEGPVAAAPPRQAFGTAKAQAVVVLPFRAPGGDETVAAIGQGLANAVASGLTRRGRTVFRPGADPLTAPPDLERLRQMGRRFGAPAVLDGSIFRSGNRVRVAVELVRVRDAAVLWAERFDETLGDPFAVEDAIGGRVIEALLLRLSGDHHPRGLDGDTRSVAAHQAYLKGRYFWERRTEASLRQGITCFEEAAAHDPAFASAHLGVADCYFLLSYYGAIPPAEGYPKVRASAQKALEIEPSLGIAHTSLGCVSLFYDWNAKAALHAFQRALALNPEHARTHLWYSEYLRVSGRFDEAIAAMERARALDPLSLVVNTSLGLVLFYARRFDAAVAQARKTLEMDPYFGIAHWVLGLALEQQHDYEAAITEFRTALGLSGRSTLMLATLGHACARARHRADAQHVLDELRRLATRRHVSPYALAVVHGGLEKKDAALACLEQAVAERTSWLCYAAVNPVLDTLRGDPRFEALVLQIGL